ncbi:MAG: hypothetical protein V5B30_18820 [Candidatus Accumulibacter delftensis]|jgi:hypothetical protein
MTNTHRLQTVDQICWQRQGQIGRHTAGDRGTAGEELHENAILPITIITLQMPVCA